jgi:hypothetical protein
MFHSFCTYTIEALEALTKSPRHKSNSSAVKGTALKQIVALAPKLMVEGEQEVHVKKVARNQPFNTDVPVVQQVSCAPIDSNEVQHKAVIPVKQVNLQTFQKFLVMKCSNDPQKQYWQAVCAPNMFYKVMYPKSNTSHLLAFRGESELISYLEKRNASLSVVSIRQF